jgi:cysteinyl-tRNA synthetase
LNYFGYEVEQVMNITDVDDKTIKGAIRDGVTLDEFTAPFTKAFFEDIKTLGIEEVEFRPRATDYIPAMIEMIQKLLDKGVAYKGNDGSVYFSIAKFPQYGALSHLKLDELKEGASERVANDEYDKEKLADFVLWKGYDKERDGEIYWESPFGKGRPGWHIECSAMATSLLGPKLDIHCGAVDNIFPHHENEIAQSEACNGCHFVKTWLHSEHLIVDGRKMSKSLGNFFTLRDLLKKGFDGREVRYLLLSVHYRTQLNFTLEGLEAARHSLRRLDDFIERIQAYIPQEDGPVEGLIQVTKEKIENALADDLNISPALAALFDFVRGVNLWMDQGEIGERGKDEILDFLHRLDHILGLFRWEKELDIPAPVLEAFEKRLLARQEKNWAEADRLRAWISSQGFQIEDTPQGPKLKK